MKTLSPPEARASLYRLLEEVEEGHEPVKIAGRSPSAALMPGDDKRALQETVYLLSIRGMQESIREGLATPIEECSEDPEVEHNVEFRPICGHQGPI